MKKKLIYLGCSSNLEIFNHVCVSNQIPIHGIIDSDYYGNTKEIGGIPVIASEKEFDFDAARKKFKFFVAPSVVPKEKRDLEKRKKYIRIIDQFDLECQTLIDKESRIYKSAELEPGCFIGYQVGVSIGTVVRSHSQLMSFALLGHHSVVGINSVLERRVLVTGDTIIGNNVHIGSGVICVNHPGMTIGDNSIIHPGIIVMRDIEPNEIVHIGGKNTRRIYKDVIRN